MKKTKRAVASILTAMMTLGVVGVAGCKNEEQSAVIPAPQTQESTTQGGSTSRPLVNNEVYGNPYAGTIVRCGQTYNFTGGSIGFLAEELTGLSADETYTVELVATVEPADAAQEVSWAVAFVNPNSEWATGKNVSDYVSIEHSEEESTRLLVTCKKGFSEQVKITCTYVHNTDISVDCVVDFVSAWENVTLKMGDDIVNLGGVTDVWWETNENADAGVAWGGDISLDIKTAEEGTVTGYTYRVDLLSPRAWYEQGNLSYVYHTAGGYYFEEYNGVSFSMSSWNNDGYLCLDGVDLFMGGAKESLLNNVQNLYLGYYYKNAVEGRVSIGICKKITGNMVTVYTLPEQNATVTIEEGSLCTVLLTVTSASGTEIQYMSLLNLTEFRYTPKASAISLSSSKIKVSYEP